MKQKQLLRTLLAALCLLVGTSATWADATWTFKDNTDVWTVEGVTLSGGNQYDKDAKATASGGVTFTGTSGFVSTAKGIGFYAVGSTSDENISIVVPAGYKATVSIFTSGNRTVVGDFGGDTQTFYANWDSSTKEFNNKDGNSPVTLYLYCDQNPGGDNQKQAPFLETITLTDVSSLGAHSWTANAVATINDIKTTIKTYSSTDDIDEGSNYNIVVDKVIKYDGNYYELSDAAFSTNVFGKSYTMGSSDAEYEYTYVKVADAVFYGEAEDIYSTGSGTTKSTGSTLLSNGEGYYASGQKSEYVTLAFNVPTAGYYRISVGMNNTNSSNRGFSYSIDDADVSEIITVNANSPHVEVIDCNLESGNHTLKLNKTYSLTPVFDYLLVTKSNVPYTIQYLCGNTSIKDADNSRTAVWGTTVELSDEDKADITFDGKKYTYSSDNASSTTIASDGTSVITVNFDCLGKAETVTYTLNVGGTTEDKNKSTITSTNESTSTSLNTLVGITNNTGGNYGTGDKKDLTVKIPTDTEYNAEHYMSVGFTVASGCKFTPTSISVTAQPVTTNKTVKLVLTDGTNSIEKTQENVVSGTPAEIIEINSGATSLTGDVTLKIYCYGATDTYRLGSPITIEGLLDYNDDIKSAIAECKTYETSADFATYIDGGTYASPAEVYAAHTAWQVAQAKANNSTDYSKVILNHAVTSANRYWGNLSDGSSSPYDGAPDNYYLTWNEGAEYSVWNGVYGLPAGKYTASTYTYSSIAGDRNQYIAVLDPWKDINKAEFGGSREIANNAGWVKINSTFVISSTTDLAFGVYNPAVNGRIAGFDNWTLELTALAATITSAGWATLYTPYALDFSGVEGLTAYTATVTNNSVTLTKVQNNVPANTGVVLEGAADTYYIPVVASSETAKGDLQGSATDATAFDAYSGYTLYILTQNGNDVQFNPCTSGSIAAGKAFLKVATDNNNSGGAKALSVVFANDPTGIANVNAAEAAQPTKRIVNGKLVIEKNGKRYNAAGAEF